jgi:hypothetical protein
VPDFLPEYKTELIFNWQATHSKKGTLDYHVMVECADRLSSSLEIDSTAQAGESTLVAQLKVMHFPARTPGITKFGAAFLDTPMGIHLAVMFDAGVLSPATIETFGRRLLRVAKEICHDSKQSVASLLRKADSV